MDPRAILFDLDGTLIDSLPGIEYAVDCALSELGLPPRICSLRPMIGPPIRAIFARLLGPAASNEMLSGLEAVFRRVYDGSAWRKTVVHANAIQTLSALRDAGIGLHLVTNKPQLGTNLILEEFGLSPYFSRVLSRDSRMPPFESKAAMLTYLISMENLSAKDCLYVGDTPEDYHAGTEAGIPVVLVLLGYGDVNTELPPSSCKTLTDLTALLSGLDILDENCDRSRYF
jgi:phosphoglycolate phosphatase